jgi:NitT/TauT family transport system substrate-binding protein
MSYHRRAVVIAGLGVLATPFIVRAQGTLERKDIKLGVGGKALLYYLPLTIAERRGFFKEQGLNVEINDFGGGSQSLQALVGGSVDVVTGAFEHTIRMQARGQDIRAVTELGRFPGIVLGVRASLADRVKKPGDLKGMKIGVTAPGSSTNFFANFLLARDGVRPEDVAIIGVGGGASAVAAMKQGGIDAISHLEPVITRLELDKAISVLADSRSEEGTRAIFGGSNPAAVAYLRHEFTEKNPNTTQAIVNAFYKSLKWLEMATPQSVAESVPEEYYLGDKGLYLEAVSKSLPMYSRSGVVPQAGMISARDMLVPFDNELKAANFDLNRTFNGVFIAKAPGFVKL